MEALNSFIDYIARTNLFNFVIFLSIIILICIKLNIKAKLNTAVEGVKDTIEESENTKAEAENKLSAIEEDMSHIGEKVEAILKESEERANLVGEKILEDAQKSALVIGENASKAIDNSRLILKNDIIKRASIASIEVAKARILEELNRNSELHNILINQSIESIEGVELQ